ncbi:MAG: AAA family ATPase [Burkholderiaceae bacterium]
MTSKPRPIALRLNGDPVLGLADGRQVALEPRAAALLALAALEPGITRLRAAAMLWPDSPDPRRNLRQQLLRFKRMAGRELLQGADTLALAEGIELEATAGSLLASWSYDDSDEFASWLQHRRNRQRDELLASARRRLADAQAQNDPARALAAAEALVALDERDEEHHRACMQLHYLAGEPAAGLAAFERLKRMLAAEFGAGPSQATMALADALRTAQGGAQRQLASPGVAALPVTLERPPLMVGRGADLAAARRVLAAGQALWIEGEAGLGKSRLIGELVAALALPQGEVLAAGGRPGDAGVPYATLARWLGPVLPPCEPGLSAPARSALKRVFSGAASDGVLRAGALAAAVAELLPASGATLLVLDDVHFADDATLELLADVASADESARRWVFATRPAEAGAAARRLRDALTELQRLQVLQLAPLGEAGVAALVDSLGVHGLHGAELAAALLRHTGGNPLFVLETIKQGLHDGSLARGALPRPQGVAGLIELRLARSSEGALMLARIAAIAGVDFSIELAEAATGARALQLANAWQELQDAQILRDEAFAHDLVAEVALRGVPQVVARRVHAQCAQWLADRGGDPVRLARHWLAGGAPAKAGHAFVLGAQRAECASRLQEEAELYAQAAAAFEAAGLGEERFDALCLRVHALKSADFGDQALDEARQLATLAADDAQRRRAQLELLGLLTERGDLDETERLGRELLALARRLGDHGTMVLAAGHLATVLERQGRPDEALPVLLDLRPWVQQQSDPAQSMLWHGDWAALMGELGRLRESADAFETACDFARQAKLPDAEGRLLLNYAVALRRNGLFDRALETARRGRALSSGDTQDATHVGIARLVVARDECETGRYGTALEALEQIIPQFEAARTPFWAQAARMMLAQLWLHLGQPARALPLLDPERSDVAPWLQADRQLLRLELARALERRAPALALRAALDVAADDTSRGPWLRVRALHHQPPAEALAQVAALTKLLHGTERFGVITALHVQHARVALAAGRSAAAERAADAALARLADGYAPDGIYRAEAWWIVSQALGAAGREADARSALQRGAQWITQHALPQVPPPFIDSFLHRNAVNRSVLAAVSR